MSVAARIRLTALAVGVAVGLVSHPTAGDGGSPMATRTPRPTATPYITATPKPTVWWEGASHVETTGPCDCVTAMLHAAEYVDRLHPTAGPEVRAVATRISERCAP